MSKMIARDMKLLMDFTRELGFIRFKDEAELDRYYGEGTSMGIKKDDFPCYVESSTCESIIAEKDIVNFLVNWNE